MLKLIEFKNHFGETLRGIVNESNSKKAIICLHGFERTSMEYKFKNIYDKLKDEFIVLRFDFSGCVMSEGDFENITVEKLMNETDFAYNKLLSFYPQIKEVCIVGHSLAGCVINKWILDKKPEFVKKLVYLGPAWNQKELWKYFFVRAQYKGKIDIDFNNYLKHFDEKAYQENIKIARRMRKAHYISDEYFKENMDLDYSEMISYIHQKKMCIHGAMDNKVPIEMNNYSKLSLDLIKVEKGDHELERPDMVDQYFKQLIKFLR